MYIWCIQQFIKPKNLKKVYYTISRLSSMEAHGALQKQAYFK